MEEKPMKYVSVMKGILLSFACIVGLQVLCGGGYLFFHTAVEVICVLTGGMMFVFARSTYPFSRNRFLLFFGWAYLFISILDFLHLVTFSGMGVFQGLDMNAPTQFWIAGRTLEGLSLFLIPLISLKESSQRIFITGYSLATLFAIFAIMRLRIFPDCFVEGIGLTAFKIRAEFGICLLILLGMLVLRKRRTEMPSLIYYPLLISMAFTILSEMTFTLYKSLDFWNMLGHVFKMISYYLILWGILFQGLTAPYQFIFKELREKNRELEMLNEKKNRFLGIAAHDLRNPLSIITMSSQVLQRSTNIDEKQAKFLQRIKTSSEYMLQLVEDLLDLAKIEAGKLHLNLQRSDIANIVENTVVLNQTLAGDKNIQLYYDFDQQIPLITFDPLKMEQVVNNLISNAIKYSYPGSRVHIQLCCQDTQVTLKVEDRGPGIPAHEIPLLFTPYAEISTKTTAGEKSTGLGLTISRRIVEGHHGRIWAESQVGHGTTFYVTLPIEPVQDAAEA